jgi:hypothetical protein
MVYPLLKVQRFNASALKVAELKFYGDGLSVRELGQDSS